MSSAISSGRLVTKNCFVTGAAQGIGHSTAQAFLREGARVIAADLQSDVAARFDEQPRLSTVVLDLTDPQAVAEAARRWDDVNVLVNCVGYVADGTVLTCSPAELERSFRINVLSATHAIGAFLPGMLARGGGVIVNVASVVSSVMAAPNRFAYAATKAAVIGLSMSVARDFVDRGIRCNVVSPGTVDTPSLHDRMAKMGDADAARRAFVARQPMGRLGSADEIASVMVLLASDEAMFMTGANIIIDGGMSI